MRPPDAAEALPDQERPAQSIALNDDTASLAADDRDGSMVPVAVLVRRLVTDLRRRCRR